MRRRRREKRTLASDAEGPWTGLSSIGSSWSSRPLRHLRHLSLAVSSRGGSTELPRGMELMDSPAFILKSKRGSTSMRDPLSVRRLAARLGLRLINSMRPTFGPHLCYSCGSAAQVNLTFRLDLLSSSSSKDEGQ